MNAAANRQRLDVLLTVAGAAGIALVFLPFTWDTVPLTDVILDDSSFRDWQFWLMVLPCVLLPFVITAGQAARVAGRGARWVSAAGFGIALCMALLYLAGAAQDLGEYEWAIIAGLSAAAFGAGAWLCARINMPLPAPRGLAALQVAYLVPMSFWLGFAHDDFQVGAWLGALTSIAYLAQIGLVSTRPLRVLAVAAPLVLLVLYTVSVE